MLRLLTVVAASSIDPLAAYHLSAISRVNRYVVGSVIHADTEDPVRKFCRFFRDTYYHLLGQAPPSELTIATLNIGGEGPQPEYIAKDWDRVFGQVEKLLGATILALYHCPDGFMKGTEIDFERKATCHRKVLGTKFYDRYFLRYQAVLDKPTHPPQGLVSKMLTKYIKEDEVSTLYKAAGMEEQVMTLTFRDFALYMFEPENKPLVGMSTPKTKDETPKVIGLSDIDKDASCKQRRSFPFFGAGFLKMHEELRLGTFKVESYTESINKCEYVKSNGKYPGKFLPLLIFDLLVFDHFQDWFDKPETIPAAIPEPKVDDEKQTLVQRLLPEVQVLMLQEAQAAFKTQEETGLVPAKLQKEDAAFGAVGTTGKKGNFDTAVLATHALGTQDKDGKDLYGRWSAFVAMKIEAAGKEVPTYLKPEGGPTMSSADLGGVPAVTIATTHVDGHRVLLMSMHPKSDGRPCVQYAYMAMEFYKHLNKELEPNAESGGGDKHKKFELLLVGGDWNVMTAADKEEKLEKEAAAFKEDGKDPETVPSNKNGFLWTEFAKAVGDYGFDIIHATDAGGVATPTVKKVRTFLQTQFNKVAKVDETTKDVILAYPAKMVKTEKVFVLNEVKDPKDPKGKGIHAKFGLLQEKDDYFPTQNWVLDHFATYARIDIHWPSKEGNKAKKSA